MPIVTTGTTGLTDSGNARPELGIAFANSESRKLRNRHALIPRNYIMLRNSIKRLGNLRWGLAALILGLPLPIVVLAFLCGGCGGR